MEIEDVVLDGERECKSLIGKERCNCKEPIASPPSKLRMENKKPLGCGRCNLLFKDKFQPDYVL